jgi:P27 family predicted phage terminase small subunit
MPGPSKMPLEKQRALGNPSHAKAVAPQYVLPGLAAVPTPPEALQTAGRDAWQLIWSSTPYLNYQRDGYWVELFAANEDEIAFYRSQIAADGPTSTGSMGQMVAHPLIAEVRKLQTQQLAIRRELGLSPSASAKLDAFQSRRGTHAKDSIISVASEVSNRH